MGTASPLPNEYKNIIIIITLLKFNLELVMKINYFYKNNYILIFFFVNDIVVIYNKQYLY